MASRSTSRGGWNPYCHLPVHTPPGAKWGCLKCLLAGCTKHRRQVYAAARRYLPDDHPYRTDPTFGDAELRSPPAKRTIADTVNAAKYAQTQRDRGAKPKAYTDRSKGVRGNCELNRLGYDYVLNSLWDIVHVLKELVKKVRSVCWHGMVRGWSVVCPLDGPCMVRNGSSTDCSMYIISVTP